LFRKFYLIIFVVILYGCSSGSEKPFRKIDGYALTKTIYETPPIFKASKLLPNSILSGPLHNIRENVRNDGLENEFIIDSEFGEFIAHRTDFVSERISEVYAIDELNKVTRTDAFAQGIAKAATSPFRAVKGLFTRPGKTISQTVKGVGSVFKQAGELVKGKRSELDGSIARELVGFGKIKRSIADVLNVDAYSTNSTLQEGMGEVAWSGYAGGVGLRPFTSQIGGDVGSAISGLKNSQALKSFYNSKSPEILRRNNRKLMIEMGVSKEIIAEFLDHKWLSPRHESVIVEVLSYLKDADNQDDFFIHASSSKGEEDSIFMMRLAEATLGFDQNVSAIRYFKRLNGVLMFYTIDGREVVILPADFLIWSLEASIIADQLSNNNLKKEIWLTGSISKRARVEFESRGWSIILSEGLLLPRLPANKGI
tara:strand:- start:1100 stop:2374 length:1275 start_codon:yes stop_codon:yes gene_type:complete